jgi:hypothetical protein
VLLVLVALVGAVARDLHVRAHPTQVAGRATFGGGRPALESPPVSHGFSLVRDEDEGFALLVPASFFKFELSRQNLDSLAQQLKDHPDPDLAAALDQFRSLVAEGGVLYFYDRDTGDDEILRKVPDLPTLSTDFLNGLLSGLKSKGIDPMAAEVTAERGLPAIFLSFQRPPDSSGHSRLVTELFLTGYQSGWVLTVEGAALNSASRDTVMNSLRVV